MDLGDIPSLGPNPASPIKTVTTPVTSPGPRTRLQNASASLGGLGLSELRSGAGSPSREAGNSRFYPRRYVYPDLVDRAAFDLFIPGRLAGDHLW